LVSSFLIILLNDRQTDKQTETDGHTDRPTDTDEDITFFAEVITR